MKSARLAATPASRSAPPLMASSPPSPAVRRLWRVHVHVNDIDAAIDAGRRADELSRITTSRLIEATWRGTPCH
jgi:hypothetical protein